MIATRCDGAPDHGWRCRMTRDEQIGKLADWFRPYATFHGAAESIANNLPAFLDLLCEIGVLQVVAGDSRRGAIAWGLVPQPKPCPHERERVRQFNPRVPGDHRPCDLVLRCEDCGAERTVENRWPK